MNTDIYIFKYQKSSDRQMNLRYRDRYPLACDTENGDNLVSN